MYGTRLTGYAVCACASPTEAKRLCELTQRYRLTLLCATPTLARAMARRGSREVCASVRYFIVGAEKLSLDIERQFSKEFGVQLLEGYGMTEATPVCPVNLPTAQPTAQSASFVPGR